jgi:hypothetical protein
MGVWLSFVLLALATGIAKAIPEATAGQVTPSPLPVRAPVRYRVEISVPLLGDIPNNLEYSPVPIPTYYFGVGFRVNGDLIPRGSSGDVVVDSFGACSSTDSPSLIGDDVLIEQNRTQLGTIRDDIVAVVEGRAELTCPDGSFELCEANILNLSTTAMGQPSTPGPQTSTRPASTPTCSSPWPTMVFQSSTIPKRSILLWGEKLHLHPSWTRSVTRMSLRDSSLSST